MDDVAFKSFTRVVINLRRVRAIWQRAFAYGDMEGQEKQDDLMIATSELFFGYARWGMLAIIVRILGQLGDQLETGKGKKAQKNLTLERVWIEHKDLIGGHKNKSFVEHHYDGATRLDFKELRHKIIAHLDLGVAMGADPPDVPIPDILRAVSHVEVFWSVVAARRGLFYAADALRMENAKWAKEVKPLFAALKAKQASSEPDS